MGRGAAGGAGTGGGATYAEDSAENENEWRTYQAPVRRVEVRNKLVRMDVFQEPG